MNFGPFALFRELRRDLAPPPGRPLVVVYRRDSSADARRLPPLEAPRPRVSLVATVRNEAASIRGWFAAIEGMTQHPDEVVVVDGGSTDGTVAILEELARKSLLRVTVLSAPGANIARGRNLAIAQAVHPVIACTDAGCLVDRDWLEAITGPFSDDPAVDVVAGYYRIGGESAMARVFSAWFAPVASGIQPDRFLPSARSVAFRRSLWQVVGGFPEWLSLTAEDTLYALELRRHARTWAFVPDAVVEWLLATRLGPLFRQVRAYARGDGEAGLSVGEYWWRLRLAVQQVVTALAAVSSAAAGAVFGGGHFWVAALLCSLWLALRIRPPASLRLHSRGVVDRVRVYWAATAVNLVMIWAMAIGFVEGVRRRLGKPAPPQQPATPAEPEPQPF